MPRASQRNGARPRAAELVFENFLLYLTVMGWPWDCDYIGMQPGQVNIGRLNLHEVFDVYCTDDLWTVIQSRGQFGNPED